MDAQRFDALTKRLATGHASRRTVLRWVGSSLTGVLLAGLGDRAVGAAPGGNSACAHFCAAVFGADTPGADACTSAAAHGQGLCAQCGPAAPSGTRQELCGQTCVDTTSDAANCGGCGIACAAGQTCCAGACVDTSSDSQNCGACGNACTTSLANATPICANGQCGVACAAAAGAFPCGGACCASGQVCTDVTAGKCCTPEGAAAACGTRTCGTVTDNCGQSVSCGSCGTNQTCQNDHCCVPSGQSPAGGCTSLAAAALCCSGACSCTPLTANGGGVCRCA